MSSDWQSIVVYVIVALAFAVTIGRLFRCKKSDRSGCGKNCACSSGVRRDPAIQQFIDRREKKK